MKDWVPGVDQKKIDWDSILLLDRMLSLWKESGPLSGMLARHFTSNGTNRHLQTILPKQLLDPGHPGSRCPVSSILKKIYRPPTRSVSVLPLLEHGVSCLLLGRSPWRPFHEHLLFMYYRHIIVRFCLHRWREDCCIVLNWLPGIVMMVSEHLWRQRLSGGHRQR